MQKTFKIGKNFDSPSEDGPSYVFSFKSVKKWQSYEHFYKKNLKKSNFWPTVQKKFKIGTYFDSPSEDGLSCIFLSKSVKKGQSYEHFCQN